MRKFIFKVFTVSIFALFTLNVSATSLCSDKEQVELNSMVANIKSTYEEKEGILDKNKYPIPDAIIGTPEEETYVGKYNYFAISVLNLTDKFYFTIKNNVDNTEKTYSYADASNGVVTFDLKDISKVVTFTIKIYSTKATNCENELFRTIYLTTPRYNEYYGFDMCESASKYYLCQKYVTFNEITFSNFQKQLSNYLINGDEETDNTDNGDTDKWYEKVGSFIGKNKVWVVLGCISITIVIVVVTRVIIVKRRRNEI